MNFMTIWITKISKIQTSGLPKTISKQIFQILFLMLRWTHQTSHPKMILSLLTSISRKSQFQTLTAPPMWSCRPPPRPRPSPSPASWRPPPWATSRPTRTNSASTRRKTNWVSPTWKPFLKRTRARPRVATAANWSTNDPCPPCSRNAASNRGRPPSHSHNLQTIKTQSRWVKTSTILWCSILSSKYHQRSIQGIGRSLKGLFVNLIRSSIPTLLKTAK